MRDSLGGHLLLGCFFAALILSIAHSFFGLRYEEPVPCFFETPHLTAESYLEAAALENQENYVEGTAFENQESNLDSAAAANQAAVAENLTSQQARALISLLGCSKMSLEECFRLARSSGEARKARLGHVQNQRARLLANEDSVAQQCTGFLGIKEQHPDLVPMPGWMKPSPAFQEAFADLSIVGLPKTGTTQLYEILGSHPSVIRMNPKRKENCASYPRDRRDVVLNAADHSPQKKQLQESLHLFVSAMASARPQSKLRNGAKGVTLNGCVNFASVAYMWYYLRPPGRKFIVMFRDPADWLWSSWNFFDQPKHLDSAGLGKGGWVKLNYRSPELFHELLTSRSRTWAGEWLIRWRCRSLEDPRLLVSMVGKSSVLFLKNEDLIPSRITLEGGLLDKVSAFVGINAGQYDSSTYSQVLNCNNKKGFKSKCKNLTTAYKASGGRTMLPETRTLLYLQFWEICNIWANDFGVVYRDCLNVVNATEPK